MKKVLTTPGVKGVFIFVFLFLLIVALFWRPVLVLYHHQQAGKMIYQIAKDIESSDTISYRCFLGQLQDEPPEEISAAINHLLKGRELNPKNAHSSYLLGQAYCLNKEFEQAVAYLKNGQNLKGKNPNLFIEEGFASIALADGSLNSEIIEKHSTADLLFSDTKNTFTRGNLSVEQIIEAANEVFEQGQFVAAIFLYHSASKFQPLSDGEDFRFYLLSKFFTQKVHLATKTYDLPLLAIEENLVIQPKHMFRLDQAKPVSEREIDGRTYAMIFSKKSDTIMLVEFLSQGEYFIEISMLDRPPAPTRLRLSLDFSSISEFYLTNGDDQLVVYRTSLYIPAGVRLLNIKLLNDAQVNGFDRNGHIYQVKISKMD